MRAEGGGSVPGNEADAGDTRDQSKPEDGPAQDASGSGRASRQTEAELVEALRSFDPAGDLHLAAICPEKKRPGEFRHVCGDFVGAAAWILEHNTDRCNIYWQPNRVRPGLASKASADDIAAVRFFQVDIDPPKDGGEFNTSSVVEALNALPAPPSFIIHSGGGVQAFWRLAEPVHV